MANCTAKGFRLPGSMEWELAARWRGDSTNTVAGYSSPWFTQGDSASGATADYTQATETGAVAYYLDSSGFSTHAVKGKTADSLSLYDMSGNDPCSEFDGVGYRFSSTGAIISTGLFKDEPAE